VEHIQLDEVEVHPVVRRARAEKSLKNLVCTAGKSSHVERILLTPPRFFSPLGGFHD
jgi:hypothetical protein